MITTFHLQLSRPHAYFFFVRSGHNVLDYLSFVLLAIKRAANGFPGIAVGGGLSVRSGVKQGPYDQSDGREHPLSAVRQWSVPYIVS